MQCVILCGGLGTRLREETEYHPKPLVKIGNIPILWHIMKIYSHYGIKEFILSLGYKGEMIKEFFINYKYFHNDFSLSLKTHKARIMDDGERIENWNIIFADTGIETSTGGRITRIKKYIKNDEPLFLATYGDGVANVNIRKLIEFHRKNNKIATLTAVHPVSKYGVIEINGSLARSFAQKPSLEGYINGGFFVFKKEIFGYLDDDMMLEDAFPALARKNQLAVYKHNDFWHCMDTYKDYQVLNKMWETGKAGWKIW
ncbi:MAG: glucose-1-phosphate cytidylyltransferase [Candidatus Omnitrophica bacterium]|nr:glucose-1-phosphate cytidylyltransferase [Candidatus Omnitrophota bacterium]